MKNIIMASSILLMALVTACVPGMLKQMPPGVALLGPGGSYVLPEQVLPRDPQALALRQHQDAIRSGRERPGCINLPATQCIASLGMTTFVSLAPAWWKDQSLLGDAPADKDGRVKASTNIYMNMPVIIKSNPDIYTVTIQTDDSEYRYVNSVNIHLTWGWLTITIVDSIEELREFHVFQVISPFMTAKCPDLTEGQLYEFIFNDIFRDYTHRGYSKKMCGVSIKWQTDSFVVSDEQT